jgi:hypothetical protein
MKNILIFAVATITTVATAATVAENPLAGVLVIAGLIYLLWRYIRRLQ